MKSLKIGTCQLQPAHEIEDRKDQFKTLLLKTKDNQIDFLCLPEGFLTGYYHDENLARQSALDIAEDDFECWVQLTAGYQVTLIVGFNETSESKLFDSAAVIENGKLLGIQRKHFIYHSYFSSGNDFNPFHAKGVNFGIVICLDTQYFEPARLLALKGATILFSPMCNKVPIDHAYAKRPSYYSHFVARSFENRCWLITSDWVWSNDGSYICPGHTVVYNPDGQEIKRSQEGVEQMLEIEISRHMLYPEKGTRVLGSRALANQLAMLASYQES